jgi:hypothetical protein
VKLCIRCGNEADYDVDGDGFCDDCLENAKGMDACRKCGCYGMAYVWTQDKCGKEPPGGDCELNDALVCPCCAAMEAPSDVPEVRVEEVGR